MWRGVKWCEVVRCYPGSATPCIHNVYCTVYVVRVQTNPLYNTSPLFSPLPQEPGLQKLRVHFFKDIRRQLYNDDDDRVFYNLITRELHDVDKRLDEGRAALHHLEMQLINVACDDPGSVIGSQLALPMLQDRLDAAAMEFAAKRAAEAEEQIMRMEVCVIEGDWG